MQGREPWKPIDSLPFPSSSSTSSFCSLRSNRLHTRVRGICVMCVTRKFWALCQQTYTISCGWITFLTQFTTSLNLSSVLFLSSTFILDLCVCVEAKNMRKENENEIRKKEIRKTSCHSFFGNMKKAMPHGKVKFPFCISFITTRF